MRYFNKFIGFLLATLNRYKKKGFLFLLLVSLFFTLRFPYEEGVSFLLNQIKKNTNYAFNFHYDSFSISLMGGPTIVFQKPEVYIRALDTTLRLNQIKLSPSYLSLLTLHLGGKIHILLQNSSPLDIVLKQKTLSDSTKGLALDLHIAKLDPQALRTLFPQITQWKAGNIQLKVSLDLDLNLDIQPEGKWFLEGKNIETSHLSFSAFTQNPNAIGIGSFPFPPFKWASVSSQGSLKGGEIMVSSLQVGEEKDNFQVKLAGQAIVPLQKRSYSLASLGRLENYDFGIEIQATENMKSKLFFLDLLFGDETQTQEGEKTKYLARIKGNRSQRFNLIPIQKLPTLEEIVSPQSQPSSSNSFPQDGG